MTHWTSDAMLTLAVIRAGKVAPLNTCAIGDLPDGSRWRAVDPWGRVTGTVQKGTPGGASSFRVLEGTRGVGVYVRAADPWSVPPSAKWQPTPREREGFERWRARLPGKKGAVRFFASTGPKREFAAMASDDRLRIAHHVGHGAWRLVHAQHHESAEWPVFELRAIVDMTGDGMPELVYHWNEEPDGHGHEVVLAASRGGRSWKRVSDNHDGCP